MRRAASISALSAASGGPTTLGQSLRCTDGARVSVRYISSARNGHSGASSCDVTTRQRYSTAWAPPSVSWSGPPQNRGRDRRTYQFDMSSTNVAMAVAAPRASKASRSSVTRVIVPRSWERIHLSMTWLVA